MPQSLNNLLYHIIFSTKNREPTINPDLKPKLHAYLAGICENQQSPALKIGGVEDHVHLFCRLSKTLDVAALIRHRSIDGEAIGQGVGCLAQQPVGWRCHLDRPYRHRSHYAGPAPEIRFDRQRSAHCPKPVSHVRETGPVAGVAFRKPGAVVEHLEVDRLLLADRDRRGAGPLRVLRRVLKRLETTEVDGTLDLGRVAPQTPRG